MSDFYKILGVDRNADQEEIKRAYRRLAAQHHPDRGGDTKKFQEIQAAYETLSDSQKRAQYDNPQPQGGFPGGFHFHANGFPPGFEDIFGEAFGGMFRRQPQRNRSLNIQTEITLEESFFGKNLMATLNLPSGREQIVDIKIPAGIQDGTTLRLSGMGDDSIPNMPRGDLHLTVHVRPHNTFKRHNDDLIKSMELNALEAILGKSLYVETLDKKTLEIKITPGTQHGQIYSIPGHGMPNINNNSIRGKLMIEIIIKVPTNLSNDQKELLKKVLN